MATLEAAKVQQEKLFDRLQRLYDFTKDIKGNQAEDFLVRAGKIEEHSADFENYALKYWEHSLAQASTEAEKKLCTDSYKEKCRAYEELYHAVAYMVQKCKKLVKTAESAESVRHNTEVKLPKIELKTFDGTRTQWPVFYENFKTLIHDNKLLSSTQKLQYLSSSLKGNAESYVKNVQITEANYPIVWKALIDHYQDDRALGSSLLETVLSHPPMQTTTATTLTNLVHTLYDAVEALNALKFENLDDFILLNIALKKLPNYLRKLFENQLKGTTIPTFKMLMDFLRKQAKIAEITQTPSPQPHQTNKEEKTKTQPTKSKVYLNHTNQKKSECPVCKGPHSIYKCDTFKSLTTAARAEQVKELNRCTRCLGGHSNECKSKFSCKECNMKNHHTLLHVSKTEKIKQPTSQNSSNMVANLLAPTAKNHRTLLGTAIVAIKDADGEYQHIRAILDSGAMSSFITKDCAQRLRLPVLTDRTSITGLADKPVKSLGAVECLIKPRQRDNPKLLVRTIIIPVITDGLPSVKISSEVRNFWSTLDLADPDFDTVNAKVDMLLGSEVYCSILSDKRRITNKLGHGLQTIFGWVLMGKVPTIKSPKNQATFICTEDLLLKEILIKFWQTEEPCHKPAISPEDEICENMFQTLHYREPSGQYVVPILLKTDNPVLTGSYELAKRQLIAIQARLRKSPAVQIKYSEFMEEYANLGHMLPSTSHGLAAYYIPHHSVIKESSLTTKLRVVFNASMPTPSGLSLNQVLYTGPKLQADIVQLIIRFRTYRIAFKTDLCKMFRQILIRPQDRKYQHILWESKNGDPVVDYELQTVTYGTASAPYLANRVLKQLIIDEGHDFPDDVRRVINEETYIDDSLSGADSIDDAIKLRDGIYQALHRGHFAPRQWASSHQEVLEGLPTDDIALSSDSVNFDRFLENSLGVLGLRWVPVTDSFSYNKIEFKSKFTKRAILSDIARVFDPLGWATPSIILGKLIIQVLWNLGIGWDDPVPTDIADTWSCLISQIHLLNDLTIPRLITNPDAKSITLIGFADASQKAYAAAIYVRVPVNEGFDSNLLMAKSKVGPTKPHSIPRMELCGAELLAKIIPVAVTSLEPTPYKIEKIVALTDSTTVLSWLTTPAFRLKTYVANRVVNITDAIHTESWFHVSSADNAADIPSRGILPQNLVNNTMWWKGPAWLTKPQQEWPISNITAVRKLDVPELKPEVKILVSTEKLPNLYDTINKVSSLTRLQRIIAWALRFPTNARSKEKVSGPLSAEELKQSLLIIIKEVQRQHFSEELELIEKNKHVPKLASLNPFIDTRGVLRVGGRLTHSDLPYEAKHPCILPKCHFTEIIVRHFHALHLHAGPKLLQSIISQEFWIIAARNVIRSQLHKCVKCFRNKPHNCIPIMGNLPKSRVVPARCFLKVSTDFGGPFHLKESKRRNSRAYKAYICLFICMSTKAVHIEPVTDLTAEGFIAALDRFTSRRGLCREIYSDNATNYIGAENHFSDLYKCLTEGDETEKLKSRLADRQITWHHSPPSGPHFNGLSEAGIKSVKFHLHRVMGDEKLTMDSFSTLLCKIEAVLNSRPLCPITADVEELTALTPAHFIIGAPLLSLPEYNWEDTPSNRLSKWQHIQKMSQQLWQRWSKEYLSTLQTRQRWTQESPPLRVNDVVVVAEDNMPPLHWSLARVTELHPGADKVPRVATIRVRDKLLKRPVAKLYRLPTD